MSEFRNPYIQQRREARRDYRDRRNVEGYDRGALRDEYRQQRADIRAARRANKGKNEDKFGEFMGKASPYIGAAVEGAVLGADYFGDVRDSINEYRDMEFQPAETMIGGVPTYGGVSDIGSQVRSIDINEAGKGLIGQGALTGAQIGLNLMAVNPVVGGIATGVGALAGTIAGAFGKKKAKTEAEEAIERGQQQFTAAQSRYNEGVEDYFDEVDAQRGQIQGDRNYQSRMYGLNQYNDPFRSIV
jgi:hypothetical protein